MRTLILLVSAALLPQTASAQDAGPFAWLSQEKKREFCAGIASGERPVETRRPSLRELFAEGGPSWDAPREEVRLGVDVLPKSEEKGGFRPISIGAGVGSADKGRLSGSVSAFVRFPMLGSEGLGTLGVSPGLGINFSGGKDHTLGEEWLGSYESYDDPYGYGPPDREGYYTRRVARQRAGRTLVELARLDYQTPRLGPVRLYAGVGAGVGHRDGRTNTVEVVERHERRYDPATDTYGSTTTEELTRTTLERGAGHKGTAGFLTARAGCRVDMEKATGIPCDVYLECQKLYLPKTLGRDNPIVVEAGVAFGLR